MPQYTIIANTPRTALYLSFQKETDARLIASLLTGNPGTTLKPKLYVASAEFNARLHLLDLIGESSYESKRFFNEIPTNQHFFFFPSHIDDRIQLYIYVMEICRIDNVALKSYDLGLIAPFLINHYEMRVFNGSPENRKRIGENEKEKRVCRFCGKTITTSNDCFSQKSHAISESLGNKGLICLEECDDCNKHFNNTIEQDISKFFRLQLILNGVKGKRGTPTIKGKEVSVKNKNSNGNNTIVFNVEKLPFTLDMQIVSQYISQQLSSSSEKYIPQNIYKCFCKYVLSLMDSQYLAYFQETIKWIKEPLAKHRLPPVWYDNVSGGDFPSIAIMTRKHNHKDIPYCLAILNVAGLRFLFIIPFCSQDKFKFVRKSRVKYFLNGVKNILPNMELNPMSLNGVAHVKQEIDFNLEISPNCVEGRDYFIESNS